MILITVMNIALTAAIFFLIEGRNSKQLQLKIIAFIRITTFYNYYISIVNLSHNQL